MSYQVLARKWRPRSFTELVGQEHVVRALVNGLDTGRLHHAFLFTGTRGIGKTTVARILAKSLNCERGVSSQPCGACSACAEIDEGRFVDLIEVDAASRTKVEDTRDLLDNVLYAPTRGRYKVYLIDEVHMLSAHSFNALLKTLEEPPPHVKFLLATTDPQKLPVTILSRCLQFNLKRLPADLMHAQMATILDKEGLAYEPGGLQRLARAADGSMRDALSLLDQAIAYGAGRVAETDVCSMLGSIDQDYVFAILQALAGGDGAAVLAEVQRLAEQGPDFAAVLQDVISVLHQVALAQVVPASLEATHEHFARISELVATMPPEDVQLNYQIAINGQRDLPWAPDPRSGFEMVLLRMLAFRPAGGVQPQRAAGPRGASVSIGAHESRSRRGAPATAGVASRATAGAAQSPQPRSVVAPTAAPMPTSAPALQGEAEDDWGSIVLALKLGGGLARELANNSEFLGRDADVVRLRLNPVHANLRSERVEERLRAALEKYYDRPIRLQIDVGAPERETPAEQRAKRVQERQQAAERAIQKDANVQALVQHFDANVLEDSIEPLDPSERDG